MRGGRGRMGRAGRNGRTDTLRPMGGYLRGFVSYRLGFYFVISTRVILNAGYIYTIALFKRGLRVCVYA